jgi:transposase-like protein
VPRAARALDVHENVLRTWMRESRRVTRSGAFPGKGVMKPEAAEIERLKERNVTLRKERDILEKGRGLLRVRRHDLPSAGHLPTSVQLSANGRRHRYLSRRG